MNQILIIDNFLNNPIKTRYISLLQKFYSKENHPNKLTAQSFPGMRSAEISILDKSFFENFVIRAAKEMGISGKTQSSLTFNYLTKNIPLEFHTDTCQKNIIFSGVLYLNKFIGSNYGTNIGGYEIESKFNRLVLYNGSIPHKPIKSFGNNKFNSRMTLNFFMSIIE
jgi:hypothetical protein